jgi:pimeloyl-ACP methyl ester carboxylesterase
MVEVRVSEVTAGGYRVYARRLAEGGAAGQTLVLVHGMVVAGRGIFPLARELAGRGYVVHLPDLPGFGRSAKPRRALDVPGLGRALAAWMRARAIAPAVLVGNSFGTQVAAATAAGGPGLGPDGVVLVAPTIDPRFRGTWTRLLPPGLPGGPPWDGPAARVRRRLIDQLIPDEAVPERRSLRCLIGSEYLAAGPVRALSTYRHALRDDLTSWVRRIEAPVTVVRGDSDRLASRCWAEAVAATAASGRVVEVAGVDHDGQFHRPAELADALAVALGGRPRLARQEAAVNP